MPVPSAPIFVKPMLLARGTELPEGDDWLAQLKLDGIRGQLRVVDGEVGLRTRQGRRRENAFPEIVAGAAALPDVILDGEIVLMGRDGAPDFAALRPRLAVSQKRVRILASTRPACFYAFDVLWHNGRDLRRHSLSERRRILEAIPTTAAMAILDSFPAGAPVLMKFARERSLEGVVVKRADSLYRSGRSTAWQKFKIRNSHRVWITAWRPGEPGQLDRYWVGRNVDGILVPAGEVAFGLKAGQAAALRLVLRKASLGHRRGGLIPVRPIVAMTVDSHGRAGGWLRDPVITSVHIDPTGLVST